MKMFNSNKVYLLVFILSIHFNMYGQTEAESTQKQTTSINTNPKSGIEVIGFTTAAVSSNYTNMRSFGVNVLDEEVVGSPFFYDDFRMGSVLYGREIIAKNVGIRYNVMDDIFEVKLDVNSPDNEAKGIVKSPDFQIKIGNTLFIAMDTHGTVNYFEVIYTDKNYTLLKQHKKKFTPAILATTSLTRSVPATFKNKEALFLLNAAGTLKEIPNSKNKIIKVLNHKPAEVKKIIKEKELNIINEKDLISLLRALSIN